MKTSIKNKCVVTLFCLGSFWSFSQENIQVNGVSRNMIVHAPSGLEANRPLVISLHGLNQSADYQKSTTQWESLGETEKFVVVYPDAINSSWDISGDRDVDFIVAVIDDMSDRFNIDRNRVYVTGFSMGGMMSYHTANKIADKVAAIGPVSGYLFANPVSSSRPMPIIHIHGTTDDVVRYSGVAGVLEKWRGWNECPSTSTTIQPYPSNRPGSSATYQKWEACNNSDVVLISLANKGHWHSNDNVSVHSTKEIWNFVKNYSLGPVVLSPVLSLTSPTEFSFSGAQDIAFEVNATDEDGTITKVEFFNGNTHLLEDVNSPYEFTWNNVEPGQYQIKIVATDNEGNTTELLKSFTVNVSQTPYNNLVHQIPGKIEFEEYDLGGNGFAYKDDSEGKENENTFRNEDDVDMEECSDVGGGFNIGFATAGEWLEYTVNVQNTGDYSIDLRTSCDGTDRTITLSIDGTTITQDISIPNTSGWQTWTTVNVPKVSLVEGKHVLRATIGATDYVNLNFLEFKSIITGTNQELGLNKVSIYPNPFSNEGLKIDLEKASNYVIKTLGGITVEKGKVDRSQNVGINLEQGIYLLILQNGAFTSSYKIVRN